MKVFVSSTCYDLEPGQELRTTFSLISPFPEVRVLQPAHTKDTIIPFFVRCRYHTGTGYQFADISVFTLVETRSGIVSRDKPRFVRKEILDMKPIV